MNINASRKVKPKERPKWTQQQDLTITLARKRRQIHQAKISRLQRSCQSSAPASSVEVEDEKTANNKAEDGEVVRYHEVR